MSAATVRAAIKAERLATEAVKMNIPIPVEPEKGVIKYGTHSISAAEVTAATLTVDTGLTQIERPVFHLINDTSHAITTSVGLVVTVSGGSFTVAVGTGTLTAGDSIVYFVRGY